MASTTVTAGSSSISYTASSSSNIIRVTNPTTGTGLATSTTNAADAVAQLNKTVASDNQLIQELQPQLAEQQARLDPSKSAAYNAQVTADIQAIQNQITAAQSDIQAAQDASAELSANGDTTLSTLASQNITPTTQDTAQASVDNQNPNAAQAAAVNPANQLSTQEQINLSGVPSTQISTDAESAVTSNQSEVNAVGTDYTIAPNFNQTNGPQTEPGGGGYSATNPDSSAALQTPLMNPLHSYPSYTYGISLAMMTIDEYNQVVKTQQYTPKRVIIASAGRYNNTKDPNDPNAFIRAPYFAEDFYFDSLSINTVIGLNEHSRATNAIKTSFTIIEPYGMTLVDRIIKLCSSPDVMARNYVEQPYMLQIDFFATDDTGVIVGVVPNQTKRIPIKILSMNIKASNKGAEYQIEAAPFNHSAFDISTMSTPAHFEVVAGTVASFFQSTESESYLASAQSQRETATSQGIDANGNKVLPDGTIQPVPLTTVNQTVVNVISSDPVYRVKSYGSAYNAWFDDMVKTNKIKVADKIYFKFAPELQNAKFILGQNLSPKDTPMADEATEISMRAGNAGAVNAALDYSTQIFSINTGTSIDMVINYVIRNSDYIQNQLVVPEDFGSDSAAYQAAKLKNKDLPLKWFKVVPQVTLIGYDIIRKVWAREITYNVVTYDIYNTKIAAAPQGTWTKPLKLYNYYYTGKNLDVLDFNLEFNALYYTAVTAYKKNMAATYGLTLYDDHELNPSNYDGIDDPANAVQPMKEKPQTLDARARATGGDITPKDAAAVDTQESLYTSAGGDMLQGQLKIIGDPQYIKQDDTFYAPVNVVDPLSGSTSTPPASSDDRLIADGSLHMDQQEVYIQVTFRTPSDLDESTGLMKFDSDYQKSSLFSGMFRVLTVESTFSGGKFEQTLDIVRLPRQSTLDYVADNQTTQRSADGTAIPTNNVTVAPPTTSSPTTQTTGDVVAPNSAPVEDNPPPITTADQINLSDTANNAPTQDITTQNEPQAVVNTTSIGTNANAPTTPAQVDSQANSQYQSQLQNLSSQLTAAISQRDTLAAQRNSVSSAFTALEDQLISSDPTVADMSTSEIGAKYPQYAQLQGQLNDLSSQVTTLNTQINSLADQASNIQPPPNATTGVVVTYSSNTYGPAPTITLTG